MHARKQAAEREFGNYGYLSASHGTNGRGGLAAVRIRIFSMERECEQLYFVFVEKCGHKVEVVHAAVWRGESS